MPVPKSARAAPACVERDSQIEQLGETLGPRVAQLPVGCQSAADAEKLFQAIVAKTDGLAASNSLTDLAVRIKAEHTAAAASLKDSVRHAIAAGELLIEAKALVPHGQWLPWLADHVSISERTAQLYMRVAKNRAEVEKRVRNGVADLTLNEAAGLLALSSDVRKLFEFAKQTEGLSGDELIQACLDAGVGVIANPGYNPFYGRSDDERREWLLFVLWLARRWRNAEAAWHHVEWLLQRPFQNVAEWLGEEGEKFCARWRMSQISKALKTDWSTFLAKRRSLSEAEITADINAVEVESAQKNAAPPRSKPRPARRRHRGGGR
jgi:hypothetical protein